MSKCTPQKPCAIHKKNPSYTRTIHAEPEMPEQIAAETDDATPRMYGLAEPEEKPRLTLPEFIEKHGLGFSCHRVDTRPDGLMSEEPEARHFRCRISERIKAHPHGRERRSMGLYFTQGSAHTADPTLAEVLSCLASDAVSYETASVGQARNGSFEPFDVWCGEIGYDTDSRQAEKIFRAIKRQAEQLKRTIGAAAYQELLWETEQE